MKIFIDKKHETVIMPVFGIATPFHIATIKVSHRLWFLLFTKLLGSIRDESELKQINVFLFFCGVEHQYVCRRRLHLPEDQLLRTRQLSGAAGGKHLPQS